MGLVSKLIGTAFIVAGSAAGGIAWHQNEHQSIRDQLKADGYIINEVKTTLTLKSAFTGSNRVGTKKVTGYAEPTFFGTPKLIFDKKP